MRPFTKTVVLWAISGLVACAAVEVPFLLFGTDTSWFALLIWPTSIRLMALEGAKGPWDIAEVWVLLVLSNVPPWALAGVLFAGLRSLVAKLAHCPGE